MFKYGRFILVIVMVTMLVACASTPSQQVSQEVPMPQATSVYRQVTVQQWQGPSEVTFENLPVIEIPEGDFSQSGHASITWARLNSDGTGIEAQFHISSWDGSVYRTGYAAYELSSAVTQEIARPEDWTWENEYGRIQWPADMPEPPGGWRRFVNTQQYIDLEGMQIPVNFLIQYQDINLFIDDIQHNLMWRPAGGPAHTLLTGIGDLRGINLSQREEQVLVFSRDRVTSSGQVNIVNLGEGSIRDFHLFAGIVLAAIHSAGCSARVRN